MTRVSNLEFTAEMNANAWKGHRVEMPSTDAQRYISSAESAAKFIAEFGDVEIVKDDYYGHYAVESFKVGRDAYDKLKQADCDRYGSN